MPNIKWNSGARNFHSKSNQLRRECVSQSNSVTKYDKIKQLIKAIFGIFGGKLAKNWLEQLDEFDDVKEKE